MGNNSNTTEPLDTMGEDVTGTTFESGLNEGSNLFNYLEENPDNLEPDALNALMELYDSGVSTLEEVKELYQNNPLSSHDVHTQSYDDIKVKLFEELAKDAAITIEHGGIPFFYPQNLDRAAELANIIKNNSNIMRNLNTQMSSTSDTSELMKQINQFEKANQNRLDAENKLYSMSSNTNDVYNDVPNYNGVEEWEMKEELAHLND